MKTQDPSISTDSFPPTDAQKLKVTYSRKVLLLIASAAALIFLLVVLMTYFKQADKIVLSNQDDYSMIDTVDELLIEILRIETSINDYVLTGEQEYLLSFERHVGYVDSLLLHVQQGSGSYLAKTSIVPLKKDINFVTGKLQEMVLNASRPKAKSHEIMMASKELLQGIRDKLREIRGNLVERTKNTHQENLRQFSRIKWAMISICAVSFSLILLLFHMTTRQDQLNKAIAKTLAAKNDELEGKVVQRTDELMGLAAFLTRLNEDEKKRIARELHDELGALLTAANMDTSWIARNLNPEDKARFSTRLNRLAATLKKGIELKRQIIDSLVPPLLRELGLIEALNDMIKDEESYAPQTTYHLEVSADFPVLDKEQELALFRICQESLTNIKKYAEATEVYIRVTHKSGNISMSIEDNGVGFDIVGRKAGTHGLAGMRSRAAMFGGQLEVQSSVNEGTRISVSLEQQKPA